MYRETIDRNLLYLSILTAITITIYIILLNTPEIWRYGDEDVYIDCGEKYVNGIAPKDCNFEHPPLGKYIVGLAIAIGINRYMLLIFYSSNSKIMLCELERAASLCSTSL